jgi:hypothetical protein
MQRDQQGPGQAGLSRPTDGARRHLSPASLDYLGRPLPTRATPAQHFDQARLGEVRFNESTSQRTEVLNDQMDRDIIFL